MASPSNTFRQTFRMDERQYRVLDELLRHPGNSHLKTISDAIRRGIELVIVECGENTNDQKMIEAAKLAEKVRRIRLAESIEAMNKEVRSKGGLYGVE